MKETTGTSETALAPYLAPGRQLSPWGRVVQAAARSLVAARMDRELARDDLRVVLAGDHDLGLCALEFAAKAAITEAAVRTHVGAIPESIMASATRVHRELVTIVSEMRSDLGGVLRTWSLRGGGVLADATRSRVVEEIAHYRRSATSKVARMFLLEAVRDKLPDDSTPVAAVVSDEAFLSMMAEADKAAAEVVGC